MPSVDCQRSGDTHGSTRATCDTPHEPPRPARCAWDAFLSGGEVNVLKSMFTRKARSARSLPEMVRPKRAKLETAPRKSMAANCFYFDELSLGTEMHIATWLVAVPWRNSCIGAFSGEVPESAERPSSGKRTSAVRAPTGQLPSKTSLVSTTSSASPPRIWRSLRLCSPRRA